MKDDNKTKKQLVHYLTELRSQNAALKKSITGTISAELAAEEARRYAESIVETVREPLLVLDADLKIISANRYFYRTFKATPGETIGSFIYDLGNKQWDIPGLRELLEEVLPEKEAFEDFEVDHYFQNIGHKTMLLNACRIYRKDIGANMILLAIEDITDRKLSVEKLKESEERYRALFDHSLDLVYITDFEGRFIDANDAALNRLGYTREEIHSLNFASFLSEDQLLLAVKTLQEIRETGIHKSLMEFRLRHKNGSDVYVETRGSTVMSNGIPVAIQSIARDVTDRKRVEEDLRKTEETYRLVVDNMADVITVMDLNLRFTYVSPSIIRLRGYTAEEVMPQTFEQIMTPESLQIVARFYEEELKLEASGTADPGRVRILDLEEYKKDGSTVWLENHLSALRDKEKKLVGIIALSHDITDRKRVEKALKESEKKYRLLADNVNDVIFVLDMNLNYTYISPSVKILRGYEPEEALKQPSIETLTPSSWDLAVRTLSEVMDLEKSERREIPISRTLQLEMSRKDGTTVWTEVKFSFIRDENQQPVGILGVTRDITERKRTEEALQRQNVYWKALNEIALGLMSRMDLADLLRTIIVRSTRFVGAEEGWICIYESEDGDFEYKAAIGKGEYRIGKRFESGRGIAGEVWRTGQTVLIDNYHVWPQRANDNGYALRRATVAVPLRYGGRLAGILGLAHYDAARRFEGDDLAMLEQLAELASLALDNAGLYDRMKQELIQRKRADEKLLQATERLRRSLASTVHAISAAVEAKDPYTSGHQRKTADLARAIATEMGLSEDRTDFIRIASTIHDIGKISVPAEILSKPTKLSEIEFSLIKVHPQAGYDILKDIEFPWPVANVILQHHERMDGSGYPEGLKGEAILMEARILAVADVVEAIASHRPYRPALGIDAALNEIEKNSGIIYDKTVVDACLRLFREKGFQLERT